MEKKLHLICNAHIDPVWLWQWEEGAAEALSTFRIAADFCMEYDGFVFNHNEAILYKWVDEYEPELFRRIQRLVKEGKWHIMGGWYLQPDCNMPSGESFVRQCLHGRNYFMEKFGVVPRTAVNFDSFGHTRGLVQILKKSGYNSYIVCRPSPDACPLPSDDIMWVGFDGSAVVVHRSDENYNSIKGRVDEKLKEWLKNNNDRQAGLFLWGIGNHGGGPSRKDLDSLSGIMDGSTEYKMAHSIPEDYFDELQNNHDLPGYKKSLQPCAPGCYTSQIRIKQKHRKLENEIYMVEKMASSAVIQGYMEYPGNELGEALRDLMASEFHDALPGSATKPVEEDTLRLLEHGLEITSRLKAKAFFALCSGQKKVADGETPILIYNPHPFKVKGILECEFVLPAQNWSNEFTYPVMYGSNGEIPCQTEKEESNFAMDWRKRCIFTAELLPGQMNRFDCRFKVLPHKPEPRLKPENGEIVFNNGDIKVVINCATGLIDKYEVKGIDYLKKGSFAPVIVKNGYNSWGFNNKDCWEEINYFKLMSREEGSSFSGLGDLLADSVRIIEDGAVRAVIEAVFKYRGSSICQKYKLPVQGTEIHIETLVFWNEKDSMLKLSIPTLLEDTGYLGQTAYGIDELQNNGEEAVSQKWTGVFSQERNMAVTCINDCIHGSDFKNGEIRLSLLRSAGYAAADFICGRALPADRYSPRMDQGERQFNFWINAGEPDERLESVDSEAVVHNEKPFALSYCPSGEGTNPATLIELSDKSVQLSAFKKAENSEDYIIRLFESTGKCREVELSLPVLDIRQKVRLGRFEIKTLQLDAHNKSIKETDLMEGICQDAGVKTTK